MYEPTLHTPLLMRFPPLIKAGSTSDQIALNLDYGATFLDLAGIKKPTDVQGESLIPIMTGQADEKNWRQSMYYHYYEYPGWHSVRKHYGVRTMTHKLMKFYGDDVWDYEMYDLVNDPNEMINVYDLPQYADAQKELHTELARLQKYYKDTSFNATMETPADVYPADYQEQWTKQKLNYIMQNMELIGDEEEFFQV